LTAGGVKTGLLEALVSMMLIRYQGRLVGFVGVTRFDLVPELELRAVDDVDRRRVTAVCEWALSVRRLTGCEPGRLPHERG
jgi:hypothetical protein